MGIHREGYRFLLLTSVLFLVVIAASYWFVPKPWWWIISAVLIGVQLFFLQFFRDPQRPFPTDPDPTVIAPADGKVVTIERTMESEFLNEECTLVSIFMSVTNVHINRNPVSGTIENFAYHPGKFLAAWNPKSSTENERTSIVYRTDSDQKIVMRQIAGLLARRIKWYLAPNEEVARGAEMGFIKFGSRVDLYLPLSAEIKVKTGDIVVGKETPIAVLEA